MTILLMIVAVVLLILAMLVMIPSNLDHVKGYNPGGSLSSSTPSPERNLLAEAQAAMLEDGEVTISEEALNQYLARRIKGKQHGAMGGLVKFKGVAVDLRTGGAEVTIERAFMGIPTTMSVEVELQKLANGGERWALEGGSIGKLGLSSSLGPVVEAFLRLATAAEEEVELLDQMNVRFQRDQVVLKGR